MARYIDADKAIFELGIEDWEIDCKYFIEEQPTADVVEVVHGEWQRGKISGLDWYSWVTAWVCSNCGYGIEDRSKHNAKMTMKYCPNCGAKMNGKKVE